MYQDESVIIDIWVQITLAYKNCNQDKGKNLAKESKKEIVQIKKLFPNCIYPFYNKINFFVHNVFFKSTKYLFNRK